VNNRGKKMNWGIHGITDKELWDAAYQEYESGNLKEIQRQRVEIYTEITNTDTVKNTMCFGEWITVENNKSYKNRLDDSFDCLIRH